MNKMKSLMASVRVLLVLGVLGQFALFSNTSRAEGLAMDSCSDAVEQCQNNCELNFPGPFNASDRLQCILDCSQSFQCS